MSDESSTALTQRQAKPVELVRAALERMKPQLAMALPRHLTADRLLRVAMTAVQNTPKLLECDRTSLYGAIMTCAQLGLEPDGVLGQAYLVPFKGRVQFIPGYRGLITLARNSGDVTSIAAHEVRENDRFEFDFASGDPPHHSFDLKQDRGDIIAFYAVAKFKDGSFYWDMMTLAEVEAIRDKSQGWMSAKRFNKEADSPWSANFVEMGRKTLVRRIAKYLPMSVQKAAALADSYDTGRHTALDSHGEIVIDADSHEIDENAPALEHKQSKLDQFEEQHGETEKTEVVVETGGHDSWLENFNALEPKSDLSGTDWKGYADGVAYMISQAGKDDLAALQVSKHEHLMKLRSEEPDLYRAVTVAINERAKELAGGRRAA